MLRPHRESGLHWDSLSSAFSTSVHRLSVRGQERGDHYLKSALKWQSSAPSRWGRGPRAPLLRFLLFGFLQALKKRLFQEIQLPQGHSEEGGHVANQNSGPRVIAPLEERNDTCESQFGF